MELILTDADCPISGYSLDFSGHSSISPFEFVQDPDGNWYTEIDGQLGTEAGLYVGRGAIHSDYSTIPCEDYYAFVMTEVSFQSLEDQSYTVGQPEFILAI